MAGVMLGLLLSSLDQTAVGTAMPRIVAQLGGMSLYSWVFTSYMVTSTTTIPILGRFSDSFGRKPFYIAGLVVFMAGSALCGVSQSMVQLIVFRGFQGIGAGMAMISSMALVGDIFPPAERGKWQGLIGAVFGFASVVGPLAGGYITDNLSWHWVFYVNLPVGVLAVLVLLIALPHIRPREERKAIDYLGVTTLILSVVPLLLALSWAGKDYAWSSPQVAGLLILSGVMGVLFVLVEGRAADPIIPLSLFKNRIFSVSVVVVFFTGVAMFGAIMFIPLFVQGVIGMTATASGMVLTPMMLSLVIGSTISGQIISRWGHYRYAALGGTAILAFGMYLLAGMQFGTDNTVAVRNMIVVGFGLGAAMPVFVIAVQNALPYRQLGVVTSSIQFFRSIGGTMGVAVMGSLLASGLSREIFGRLPERAKQALPADRLAQLSNPELLLDPAALASIRAEVPAGMSGLLDEVLLTVRHSLAASIQDMFLWGAIVVGLSLVACFFLKEIPLRRTHRETEPEPERALPEVEFRPGMAGGLAEAGDGSDG